MYSIRNWPWKEHLNDEDYNVIFCILLLRVSKRSRLALRTSTENETPLYWPPKDSKLKLEAKT